MIRNLSAALAAATLVLGLTQQADAATYTYSVQALNSNARTCPSVTASAEWIAFNRCLGPANRTSADIGVSAQRSCRSTHRVTNLATGRITYAYDIPIFWALKFLGSYQNCN